MNESPRLFLEFLALSPNRMTILTALANKTSVSRAELQRETGIPRSTLSRILGELGDRGLVSKVSHRYEATPFGGLVAARLYSIFNSIAAMQRLQALLNQLSDTDSDLIFTSHTNSEILTPTSADPRAPIRRLADLLHTVSHVRLLVPCIIPMLLEESSPIGMGKPTFEIVVPHTILKADKDDLGPPRGLRSMITSEDGTLFAYDGNIPYFAGTFDETAVVGLTDDDGTMQGFIETRDERICSWTQTTFEAYVWGSDLITRQALPE